MRLTKRLINSTVNFAIKGIKRTCQTCGDSFTGRADKLFCSHKCKSAYHYRTKVANPESLYMIIDQQLKRNRALLKHFNQAGKAVIRKKILLSKGFNPKYFTHYWKNQKGDVYLFCYEYGFLSIKEKNTDKYVLVDWQPYMD